MLFCVYETEKSVPRVYRTRVRDCSEGRGRVLKGHVFVMWFFELGLVGLMGHSFQLKAAAK